MNLIRKIKISKIVDVEFTDMEIIIKNYFDILLNNLTVYKHESYSNSLFYMNNKGCVDVEILYNYAISISNRIYSELRIFDLDPDEIKKLLLYFFKSNVEYFYISIDGIHKNVVELDYKLRL